MVSACGCSSNYSYERSTYEQNINAIKFDFEFRVERTTLHSNFSRAKSFHRCRHPMEAPKISPRRESTSANSIRKVTLRVDAFSWTLLLNNTISERRDVLGMVGYLSTVGYLTEIRFFFVLLCVLFCVWRFQIHNCAIWNFFLYLIGVFS